MYACDVKFIPGCLINTSIVSKQLFIDEITTICSSHNNKIWIGSKLGTIMVIHATTLTVIFAGKLEKSLNKEDQSVSSICHVNFGGTDSEEHSLILVTYNGKIWSLFENQISQEGFQVHDSILIYDYCTQCPFNNQNNLIQVKNESGIEVWGTTGIDLVFILKKDSSGWQKKQFSIESNDNLGQTSCIVHNHFTSACGFETMSHVWISDHNKLISFDALTRKQRCVLAIGCAQDTGKLKQCHLEIALVYYQNTCMFNIFLLLIIVINLVSL